MTDKNQNSGNRNSGDQNSGDQNSGNRNSGDQNSGDRNSGYWNSGNWNSGYLNSGDRNSGNWNSGDRNSGYLNTTEQPIRLFNRECIGLSHTDIDFPDFFYFNLCTWVYTDNMTDEEKADNPTYETTDGYLKVLEYKDAWRESYDKANAEDRAKVLELPNFDADIFYEISGIRIDEPNQDMSRIETLEKELAQLKADLTEAGK